MTVRLTTRQSENFDIHTEIIDPAMSPYAQKVGDYVNKITAFYTALGIRSAMWTVRAADRPKYLETCKPVEYVLELKEDRIAAYVNECTWSDYLYGKRAKFDYSKTPIQYEMTSILVHTPITKAEVKARRRYRQLSGPNNYELIEEITF